MAEHGQALPLVVDEFVCPSCGNFVRDINDETGWCLTCSPPSCSRCHGGIHTDGRNGATYVSDSEVIWKSGRWLCRKCIRELWVEHNADRIEEFMLIGLSYHQAVRRVKNENRAVCVVCSSPIPGRHRAQTLFCKRTKACRTAKSKYLWKINHYGMSPEDALEEVLQNGDY